MEVGRRKKSAEGIGKKKKVRKTERISKVEAEDGIAERRERGVEAREGVGRRSSRRNR